MANLLLRKPPYLSATESDLNRTKIRLCSSIASERSKCSILFRFLGFFSKELLLERKMLLTLRLQTAIAEAPVWGKARWDV